eukprot:TRINITY_DN8235_c0_g2_i1.p1 TRINITY_DN8235_c0_g2~~TRINITY_DN8235_c0_g2_i1.p1  ORF type:complete len:815 (+),score=99.77 TRINITY_DN8235_c0_g2_i1:137-2581(+)
MAKFLLPALMLQGTAAATLSMDSQAFLERGGAVTCTSDDPGSSGDPELQISFLQVSLEGFERQSPPPDALKARVRWGLPKTHKVEHLPILKDARFWWCLAGLIILVAIAVVTIEVTQARDAAKEASKEASTEQAVEASNEAVSASEHTEPQDHYYAGENLKRLCFCVVGLNAAQIFWGISQEYVMTSSYTDGHGETVRMPSSLFLVLCNRLLSILFSAMLLGIRRKNYLFRGYRSSFFPAATNTVASWCQYWSLHYITFELQTAAKTAKLLPVVLISFFRGKKYSYQDIAEAITITASCVVFGLETETDARAENMVSRAASVGVALVAANILLDAMTPHFQDVMFKETPELDTVQATFAMSCFSAGMLLMALLFSGTLFSSVTFLFTVDNALLHIFVLSAGSTLTQYMISYTIKHFGPVAYAAISSLRQVLSVLLSGILFVHAISSLAWVTLLMMVGTVILRAWRFMLQGTQDHRAGSVGANVAVAALTPRYFFNRAPLLVCTVGIHVFYGSYGLLQEYLAYHTFNSKIFRFPVFIVAVDHLAGALLSFCMLTQQGFSVWDAAMFKTALPGATNMSATVLQHMALYSIVFPTQTLLKTVKILPVMIVGSTLMKNRSYSKLDYAEALFITCLVSYFALSFEHKSDKQWEEIETGPQSESWQLMSKQSVLGLVMMLGYVLIDSFTSNLEDRVYQIARLDPCRLLFGMESYSGVVSFIWVVLSGELPHIFSFVGETPGVCSYVALLAFSSAFGAYTCTLTVKYFGPAIFTLIMTSRQVLSMVLSVIFFGHALEPHRGICLAVVAFLIFTSTLRRAER